jgi:UDP-glucose:glycoprotein glucosyltransferase
MAQVWNMKDLGVQAAQRVLAASDPLRALTEIAQNFPNVAAALSRVAVAPELTSELKRLRRVVQAGAIACFC